MISVVIPVYKNTSQLVSYLKKNEPYLKTHEVIVVNDCPGTSIKSDVAMFSWLKLYENEENLGFGGAVNRGVGHASHRYIMLLNSDVLLPNGNFNNALKHFAADPDLFAVSFAQKEKDGRTVGRNAIYFESGLFRHRGEAGNVYAPNGWAEGGSSVIDKDKFKRLGGFDRLYSPFYWEDVDLSYNAWKAGYKVLFDPEIAVEHHHESTTGKYFSSGLLKTVSYRNQLFFAWKNSDWFKYRSAFYISLPLLCIYMILKREWLFLPALFQVVGKLPAVFKSRDAVKKNWTKSDGEILGIFKKI